MEKLIAVGGWLIATFAPQYKAYWNVLLTVITAAKAIADALGIAPHDAIKAASEIQFRLRKATPEEEKAMFERGMQPADQNHDFPYTTD